MCPVIRISDNVHHSLELLAVGFDNPNNVIQRLIEFYEKNCDKPKGTEKR